MNMKGIVNISIIEVAAPAEVFALDLNVRFMQTDGEARRTAFTQEL